LSVLFESLSDENEDEVPPSLPHALRPHFEILREFAKKHKGHDKEHDFKEIFDALDIMLRNSTLSGAMPLTLFPSKNGVTFDWTWFALNVFFSSRHLTNKQRFHIQVFNKLELGENMYTVHPYQTLDAAIKGCEEKLLLFSASHLKSVPKGSTRVLIDWPWLELKLKSLDSGDRLPKISNLILVALGESAYFRPDCHIFFYSPFPNDSLIAMLENHSQVHMDSMTSFIGATVALWKFAVETRDVPSIILAEPNKIAVPCLPLCSLSSYHCLCLVGQYSPLEMPPLGE